VEKHWRPEGIVAMCPLCHGDADEKGDRAGAYSKEELRAMKKSNRSSEDVKGHFPTWQDKKSLLVRVGGCYTDTSAPVILINDIPQIALGKNESGLLSLSFELRNKVGDVLVKIEDNWFTAYPPNLHDMVVTPKTKEVKVWLDEEDIGLEFSFSRITMTELEALLSRDRTRQEKIAAEREQERLALLPPEQQGFMREMREYRSRPQAPPPWVDELPDELREVYLAEDKTGFVVKRWVRDNCVMDDELIPLLNFEQMAIYFHGERITIKDGVADFLYYSAAFNSGKGAINLPCRCAACLHRATA
jgi:hypothetical protein